jgi:hypothetical protein
MIKRVKPPPKI